MRAPRGAGFEDAERCVLEGRSARLLPGTNTTLVVVATDARLDKSMTNRLAQVAHDGLARALRPAHTMFDGDTIFAASTARENGPTADFNALAIAAALATERAIVRAVLRAKALAGLPAAMDVTAS